MLQADFVDAIIRYRFTVECEFVEVVGSLVIHNPHSVRKLVELTVGSLPHLVPQHVQNHFLELCASDPQHMYRIIIKEDE